MRQKFLCVLLSVVLLSVGWTGGSGLTLLVALLPLLYISDSFGSSARDWWRMAGWAALTFVGWNVVTVWWIWIATPVGPLAATFFTTWWLMLAFMLFHYISKRAPRSVAYTVLVAAWVAGEYLYTYTEVISFPWLTLGNGFSGDVWAVQWYEYTGVVEYYICDKCNTKFKIKADGSNFQENHAQMAVARGGFIPHGPGTSMERNYLPEAFSDFIFAIIVEELSVWMGLFVIGLYLCLLFRAGRVARQSDSLFCAILVIGITMLIVLQAFIHIGVSVHLGPVTGQPLPLISRGGTSVLVNCVYFGLIISVTRHIQSQRLQKEMVGAAAVVAEPTETNIEQTNSLETEIVEEVKDI